MKTVVFLTLSRLGVVKVTKEKPKLDRNQRAIRIAITVPDAVFDSPPILDAQLDVPADRMILPDPKEPVQVEIWSEP